MPKKGKKAKKKSIVVKPEINIVEGESSFDMAEMIRQKKMKEEAEAAAAALVEKPVIEIGVEAAERVVREEVINSDVNNFSVSEVTEMRRVDSLAVVGKQTSINSNFSFFSDNNLTERDDLEEIEDHHFDHRQTTVTSYVEEKRVVTSTSVMVSVVGVSTNQDDVDTTDSVHIEELEDGVDEVRQEVNQVTALSRFTDQSEENDSFLKDLEAEIVEELSSLSSSDDEILKPTTETVTAAEMIVSSPTKKSNIGWDNLLFKKKIQLEFKETEDDCNSSNDVSNTSEIETLFHNLGSTLSGDDIITNFSTALTHCFDFVVGAGLVSASKRNNDLKITAIEEFETVALEELGLQSYSDVFSDDASIDDDDTSFLIFR